MAPILELRDVSVRFGAIDALVGVSFEVGEWEIVGVTGRNGSGKTTMLDCVAGLVTPTSGRVLCRGLDVTRAPAAHRAELGLARTFERGVARASSTVMENVLTAQHHHVGYRAATGVVGGPGSFLEEWELRQNAEEILYFLGLLDAAKELVGALSPPARRRCELAMALAADPDAVLLDEPTRGLALTERRRLLRTIASLRETLDLTIVVVEPELALLADIADFVYVLEAGAVIDHGPAGDVARRVSVQTASTA